VEYAGVYLIGRLEYAGGKMGDPMEHSNRRYSEEEVTQIIRHALSRGGVKDTISHDELVEIARASGISGTKLEAALEHMETDGAMEAAKAEWLKGHREDFFHHLTSYLIVNGFLWFVYFWTMPGRYPWPVWVMAGWGIGIAFHFMDTFFVSEAKIEKGAEKLLRQRRRRQERMQSRRLL
jgi:hypothetical protein